MSNIFEERFWAKVNKDTGTDCWEWIGSTHTGGYGTFKYYKKSILAHRMVMIFLGQDPTGMCVCHSCDNVKCVNPAHLFLGTSKDNTQDMIKKGRSKLKQHVS